MADEDDLDAFFDEVSDVEAKAVDEDDQARAEKQAASSSAENEATTKSEAGKEQEPPAKRQKTTAPVRPKGVVVASSTSVVLAAEEREEKAAEAEKLAKEQQQQQLQQQQQQRAHPFHVQPSMGPIGPIGPQYAGPSPMGGAIGPAFPGVAMMPPVHHNTMDANGNLQNSGQPQTTTTTKKSIVRMAAGTKWVDPSLDEWPENDYRIFVGNLSNEVTDDQLHQHFSKYPSLARSKVVRHAKDPDKSKGYGFVSLLDPLECAKAIREMDQTWLASRPIRVKRSDWKERDFKQVKKKQRKESKQQKRMGLRF